MEQNSTNLLEKLHVQMKKSNKTTCFIFRGILQHGHVLSVPMHSSQSSANSVVRQTVILERLACRWSLPTKKKEKKGEKKKWRNKEDKKCAPSPHLFRRLPALSFSFWAELDQLCPSARGSSIPTAIFIRYQASLGSLYWGYSALHYIKRRRLRDINGKCGIVTAVKPLLCPPFFLCLARGAEGLGIKVLLKSWDRDKARKR